MNTIKTIEHYKSPGNSIIVKPTPLRKIASNIIIPDSSLDKSAFEIIGLGLKFKSEEFNIGDVVLVNGKGGDRVDIQNGEFWIYPSKMVAAKIINEEVIPLNTFITLEKDEDENIEESGGIFIYKEKKENDILLIPIINIGSKCKSVRAAEFVYIDKSKCIEIKTNNNSIYLSKEELVLAKIEKD